MEKRRIEQLIKDYELRITADGNLAVRSFLRPTAKDIEDIKSHKEEIIQYFKDIENTKELKNQKIKAIEGLAELQKAINEYENYLCKKENAFENEFASSVSKSYDGASIKELKAKYPRASAYLLANSWTYSNNYHKSALGQIALDKIIDGNDYNEAISQMESVWTSFCKNNID